MYYPLPYKRCHLRYTFHLHPLFLCVNFGSSFFALYYIYRKTTKTKEEASTFCRKKSMIYLTNCIYSRLNEAVTSGSREKETPAV